MLEKMYETCSKIREHFVECKKLHGTTLRIFPYDEATLGKGVEMGIVMAWHESEYNLWTGSVISKQKIAKIEPIEVRKAILGAYKSLQRAVPIYLYGVHLMNLINQEVM